MRTALLFTVVLATLGAWVTACGNPNRGSRGAHIYDIITGSRCGSPRGGLPPLRHQDWGSRQNEISDFNDDIYGLRSVGPSSLFLPGLSLGGRSLHNHGSRGVRPRGGPGGPIDPIDVNLRGSRSCHLERQGGGVYISVCKGSK
ncbi:hypothetical protein GE061_018778 [Apolygus lucorum]|uniref:Uncharacterized protein n=1 Tax=Apolygus lucorum TaxID=248454 RepID=A0A6A4JKM6_APOLU|nr:hypothetical protein GE061_018778 [Apolygus lucorum]